MEDASPPERERRSKTREMDHAGHRFSLPQHRL